MFYRVARCPALKHPSTYLDWYVHTPEIRHDLRSSGITSLQYDVDLGKIDLSLNYAHGNPEATKLLAQRYKVSSENVFVSSEGTSGQNARIIKLLGERSPKKNEAIVEYPTYEPLLRNVQDHFKRVKRLDRRESEDYRLDADALGKLVSERTGLLVLTNPHAPSSAVADRKELREILAVASERGFFVLCDEIYAEFDRQVVPTAFSVDPEWGIVTTSFTKAYGLGGLKLGTALAKKQLVDELYTDVLNTVGNSPNVVQLLASEILDKGMPALEKHKQKWNPLKNETERWLSEHDIGYFPNKLSVTYWAKLSTKDTHKWTNEHAIPHHSVAPVPGAFFLFKSDYKLVRSNMVRIGIGNISPGQTSLTEALRALEEALNTRNST